MHKTVFILFFLILPALTLPGLAASNTLYLTGRVAHVGHQPFIKTVLHTAEPKTYLIAGAMYPELKNLRGATVKVAGTIIGTDPFYNLTILDVREYQVLTVDKGVKPWIGTLTVNHDLYLITDQGRKIALDGPLVADLIKQKGAKIWVTGTFRLKGLFKRVLRIDAFGIIRPSQSQ